MESKLLFGRSLTEIVSFFGFCVGCAFVTTTVRTIGYFSVIGPQFQDLFLDTDLVKGAVQALPGIIFIAASIWAGIWLGVVSFETVHPTVQHLERAAPRILSVPLRVIVNWWGGITIAAYVFAIALFDGEYFFIRFLLWFLMSLSAYFQAVVAIIEGKKIHPILAVALLIMTYNGLHDLGKLEAISALRNTSERYSVETSNKSYANVNLLRTTSNAVLLRVGGEVIYYDRSQINQISRPVESMRQR